MKKLGITMLATSAAAIATAFIIVASQPSEAQTSIPVSATKTVNATVPAELFVELVAEVDGRRIDVLVDEIERNYSPALNPQIVETALYAVSRRTDSKLSGLLERKTGQKFGTHSQGWFKWIWNQPETITDDYAEFKAGLYASIDPRFERYFSDRQSTSQIRLDEVRWGGVQQDGIPPVSYTHLTLPTKA